MGKQLTKIQLKHLEKYRKFNFVFVRFTYSTAVLMLQTVIGGNAYHILHTHSDLADSKTRFNFNWNICDHKVSNQKKIQTIV